MWRWKSGAEEEDSVVALVFGWCLMLDESESEVMKIEEGRSVGRYADDVGLMAGMWCDEKEKAMGRVLESIFFLCVCVRERERERGEKITKK